MVFGFLGERRRRRSPGVKRATAESVSGHRNRIPQKTFPPVPPRPATGDLGNERANRSRAVGARIVPFFAAEFTRPGAAPKSWKNFCKQQAERALGAADSAGDGEGEGAGGRP